MRPVLVPVLAVGSFFAACCCCCGGGMTPEERAEYEKREAERKVAEEAERTDAIARAPVLAASLWEIEALIDLDNPIARTACPLDEIRKNRGDATAPLLAEDIWYTSYEALPNAEPFGDEGQNGDWKWLDHADVARVAKVGETKDDEAVLAELGSVDHRYLVVFVGQSRAAPGKIDEGWTSSGFDGGSWEGGLVLVDLVDRKVVCGAPFTAENSETLDYDDHDDPKKVVLEDFQQNFETAANKALADIDPDLSVNLIGWF